jgi:NitT/TauT family transport system substrate-binding protein
MGMGMASTMVAGPAVMLGADVAYGAAATIKATHGAGFCNLNFFLAHALQLVERNGSNVEFIEAPNFSDQITFLATGQVDLGVLPYTSFLALYDMGAPVKIVGGGGVQGCMLIARPGLDAPSKLKGKTLGTFQLDTLEILPYDWLKRNGVAISDITVRYMGSMPEAVEAFKAGVIDMIGSIQPYGATLLQEVPGAALLSDGTDIYGPGYTDCVFAARTDLIETNPRAVENVIHAMMQAQASAETDPEAALNALVGPYYKTSLENARAAMGSQPSVVDNRSQAQFILDRTDSLLELGYIKKKPGKEVFDWSALERVIAADPALYAKLKRKSA